MASFLIGASVLTFALTSARASKSPAKPQQDSPTTFGTCETAGPIEVEATGGTTTPTAYATLKAAFDAINAGTHTGAITIDVCGDTTETASAVLNASGSGSASYTSVAMSPAGGAARTISGDLAGAPLVDLNGADAVNINGLNAGGNALTLQNISASSTTNTSTVRFIADATGNTVTNASILGSATVGVGTAGGNVVFSTGTTTGNDTNTVSNSNIGPAGANLPVKLVFGLGTTTSTATENSGVTINNNNLFDFFSATVASRAVDVNGGNTDWTISNNRVYQTATRTFTSATATTSAGIFVSNTSTTALGNNFQITGNTVGFAAANGTGVMTYTGAGTGAIKFYPIHLLGNTSTAPLVGSTISGNTVNGISLTTAASGTTTSAIFIGIYPQTGLISTTGNTIGSQTGTGGITVTSSSTTTGDVIGIFNFSSANSTISTNNIGSMTAANSSATGSDVLYGIRCDLISTVTCTIQNNNIGGTTAASINNTAPGTASRAVGIITVTGLQTVTGNTIRNMTMSAANTGTTSAASVTGISQTATATGQNISQNTIHSLSNTNATAAVTVIGISHSAATTGTTNIVARNFVHSLSIVSTSATAALRGINVSAGVTTYQNNMVRLGIDSSGNSVTGAYDIIGINDGTGTNNYYHNSVYIGGAAGTSATNSFAFSSSVTVNTRNFLNNIFANARTIAGGGGGNFAASYAGTLPNPTGLNSNFNIYFSNDPTTLIRNGATAYTLTAWRTASGNQDANSILAANIGQINFVNPTGDATTVDLHLQSPTIAEGIGTPVASVTDDFDGQTRSTLTPVDIGADAGNFTGIDISPPVITYTAFGNTSTTTNRVLSVTITDASGVASGANAPRIYYRKNGAGSYVSTQCVPAGGSNYNCTIDYSLVGGIATGDSIQYFVVAQDTLGNVASNPAGGFSATDVNNVTTPPTTPNSYSIVPSVPATLNVGTGQTYTSLTGAGGVFATLNAGALTQNTVVNVTSDLTEDGTNALNQLAMDGGTFTLTIRSDSAVERLISGAVANGMIRLNGADGVTFDGRVGGTGMFLRFRNTNTSNPTFTFLNDATGNTINSCFVESANTGTTSGTILFSTSTGTLGNSGNTITNSEIRDLSNAAGVPANAVYSAGSATALNGTDTVSNSKVYNFTNAGTLVSATGAGNGWTVSTNSYYQTAARTTALSFVSIQGGNGHSILNNSIGGTAALAGGANLATSQAFRGIDVTVGTTSPTSIQGNTVKNIRSTLAGSFTSSYGIFVEAGTVNVGNVNGNTIGSSDANERLEVSGDSYAIRAVSITSVNVSNNTVNNMTTATGVPTGEFYFGISLEGAAGAHTAINNSVSNVSNGSTPDSSFNTQTIGMTDTATGIQTIRGNTISNIGSTSTTAVTTLNNRVWGLVVSAAAAGSVVEKNKISNLFGSSPTTGARADVITGLQSQGTNSTATYSNNMVALNGGADGSDRPIFGILELATGTATNNYYFNSVNIYGTEAVAGVNSTYAYNRNSVAVVNVRDNIFVNSRTGGTGFNVAHSNTNASATGFTSNFNVVNNVDNTHLFQWLGGLAANNRTLATWRTDSGQDLNSIQGNPLFVSNTDLHLSSTASPAYNAGTTIAGITTDIDNQTRDAQPDIGADELLPGTLQFNSATYTVGEAAGTATITVTRTGGSDGAVSVDYATVAGGTATGGASCAAGVDYVNATGTLNWASGDTAPKTFNITICNDSLDEPDETVNLALSNNMGGATIGTQSTAVLTITDDDAAPTIAITSPSPQAEGNSGTTPFVFNVNLSAPSGQTVTVHYSTADGTATAPSDYTAIPDTVLTFTPGQTSQQITVLVNGDTNFEGNETFFVNLSNATNATIQTAQGTGTINNDDAANGSVTINDVRTLEGDSGSHTVTFTVTLTTPGTPPNNASVQYSTGGGTATPGPNPPTADYLSASGTLFFGAPTRGEGKTSGGTDGGPVITTRTFTVTIFGDTNKEENETFFVTLSNPVGLTIGDGTGVGIIVDDDRARVSDFDGDLTSDLAVFRPSNTNPNGDPNDSFWFILQSSNSIPKFEHFGANGDIDVPGDYDGDGKTDFAVFRPSTGTWYIEFSSNFQFRAQSWGLGSDVPAQADFDGDGRTDIAVFRPSNGTWYILQSSNSSLRAVPFGANGDKPVQGDFDGDAKADIAVFRPSTGTWYVTKSTGEGEVVQTTWGASGDKPVIGDFDGDGSADYAVFRPSTGTWYILQSLTGNVRVEQWGANGDIPVVADYDGDGTSDVAVFRPSDGNWYTLKSNDILSRPDAIEYVPEQRHWGQSGDDPVPNGYTHQAGSPE